MDRVLTAEEEELVLLLGAFPRSSAQQLLGRLKKPASQPTLSRRIEALEKAGIVRREGRARSTVYSLADARWYANLPATNRPTATYQFGWLEGYRPNQTRLMSAEDEASLTAAGRVPGVSPNLFFQRVFERFLIDLSFGSSKLEGNTYTVLDTERLINEGQQAEGKAAEEATMILNHKAAILYIVEHLAEITVSELDIKNVHSLLARDLVQEGEGGAIRTKIVNITNSRYSPLAVPQQLDEQFRLLVEKASGIESPFEQSLFLLTSISYLQPFIDVNKRTARLVANIPLLKAGLCPLSYRYMDAARYVAGTLLFYETLNADGIKAAYMDGYISSSQALRQHYEEHRRQPDRLDVAYRRGLDQVIREVVLYADDEAKKNAIIERGLAGVPAEDRKALRERIEVKLAAVSPESAAAFGLRPHDVERFRGHEAPGKRHRPR